jgi:hypothetical protein
MSGQEQLFSANLAKNAVYKTGLRSFMEYRDLGIEQATHGQFRAHVVRIKKESAGDQPPGIVHNELDCSDDLEILEVYSPAVHETVVVGRVPEAAAAR